MEHARTHDRRQNIQAKVDEAKKTTQLGRDVSQTPVAPCKEDAGNHHFLPKRSYIPTRQVGAK